MSNDFNSSDSLNFRNHCWVLEGVFNSLHLINGLRGVDCGIFLITISNNHHFGRCYRSGLNVIQGGVRNVSWDIFSQVMEKRGDSQRKKGGRTSFASEGVLHVEGIAFQ